MSLSLPFIKQNITISSSRVRSAFDSNFKIIPSNLSRREFNPTTAVGRDASFSEERILVKYWKYFKSSNTFFKEDKKMH